MSFKDFLKETEEKPFPSDDKIKEAVENAISAFWKVISDNTTFKAFIKTDTINTSENFKNAGFNEVKTWLRDNSPEDAKDLPKKEDLKNVPGGVTKPLVTPYVGANVAGQEVRY